MILSMSRQALLFLSTVCVGMILGFIFDIFRILRKTTPHTNILIHIEDVLYWLTVTGLLFMFLLHENYGEIRFFTVLGAGLGMALYFATISFLVMKISVGIIEFLKKVIATALRILFTPFILIFKIIAPPLRVCKRAASKRMLAIRLYARGKRKDMGRHWSVMRRKV